MSAVSQTNPTTTTYLWLDVPQASVEQSTEVLAAVRMQSGGQLQALSDVMARLDRVMAVTGDVLSPRSAIAVRTLLLSTLAHLPASWRSGTFWLHDMIMTSMRTRMWAMRMRQGQMQVEVLQDAVGTLQREAQSLSRTVRAYEEGIVAAIKDAATEPVEVATHQWSMLGRKLTDMEVRAMPVHISTERHALPFDFCVWHSVWRASLRWNPSRKRN